MSRVCKTEKEFADAIKNNEDEIIVEGDLRKGIIRIKVTGKIAWAVCAVSLSAAIAFYIATPAATVATTPVGGGLSFTGGVAMSTVAATTLGTAVIPAVTIGVCAGGIGVLNTLRDQYKIVEKNNTYIKLKRK